MNETLTLALAWLAGTILGVIFFGGLWWTIQKAVLSQRPALWFLGSLLTRMSIALAGFYFVARGHWQPLVACLVGFVMARLMVLWLTRPPAEFRTPETRNVRHAH
jgi:F1F0 ATPase subunit 2